MPTPTVDYQASISGLLLGATTVYVFGTSNIDGLGNPPAKTADVPLDGQDGQYASPDYLDARTLLVHLEIVADTETDVWNALKTLKIAWMPTTSDIQFHLQLPGWGHVYYLGRPRSLEADCGDAPQGHITCIGEFFCTDPHAHNA